MKLRSQNHFNQNKIIGTKGVFLRPCNHDFKTNGSTPWNEWCFQHVRAVYLEKAACLERSTQTFLYSSGLNLKARDKLYVPNEPSTS